MENLCDLGLGKDFLGHTSINHKKTKVINKTVKNCNFLSLKDTTMKRERKATDWEKSSQTTCLLKLLNSE